jgi:hypothetical protein
LLAPHLREKLDPALRLLLKDGPDHPFYSYESRQREGGGREYGVLIRTTAPDSLAKAGISLGPIPDEPGPVAIVTARLTPDEIRRIAALDIGEQLHAFTSRRLWPRPLFCSPRFSSVSQERHRPGHKRICLRKSARNWAFASSRLLRRRRQQSR